MITPAQIRGARGMLGISQMELGRMVGLSHTSIANIESGASVARAKNMAKIQAALEEAGATFLDETASNGVGVRIPKRYRK
jgi:predicted transcriptional regulator